MFTLFSLPFAGIHLETIILVVFHISSLETIENYVIFTFYPAIVIFSRNPSIVLKCIGLFVQLS